MRVSLNWLEELLSEGALADIPIEELTERLDMTGTGVEAVEKTGQTPEGIYIGQIKSKEPHPDSDHLWLTRVDVGEAGGEYADEDGLLQIVCGAQNFEEGDRVPVAMVGTVFPNATDDGKDFTIKKSKIRGIESFGMNCSMRELGLGDDHQGIMVLDQDAPIGVPFSDWYKAGDTVLDLEITPNRPDCLSMVGMAREFGAVFDVEPKRELEPVIELVEGDENIDDIATVVVEDPALCPRYTARVIKGVTVGPSPQWLADRVTAAGTRSVNNVVDITNFIMYELGQPLHAFDLGRLAKDGDRRAKIIVRRAHDGEQMTTLDQLDRKLGSENLLICDLEGPVALAGVMGGLTSEVEDYNIDILLEEAKFDPANVSRTSRALQLISESSLRFERGVDIDNVITALDRAAALIAQVGGGQVVAGAIDVMAAPIEKLTLPLRHELMTRIIGEDISLDTAKTYLEKLGCVVESGNDELNVTVPTYRPDLEREIDLVEEVLRLWGMENVEATLPGGRERLGGLTRTQQLRGVLDKTLRSLGLSETMTLPFSDDADLAKLSFEPDEGHQLVMLHNPMSSEQAILRPLLLPGLLNSVSLNKRRGVSDIHLFERGKAFLTKKGRKLPKEPERIAAVLSGLWNRAGWNVSSEPIDFFDAKGIITSLMDELNIDRLRMVEPQKDSLPWLQPGKAAVLMLGNAPIGWLGEIHPRVAQQFEIDDPVVAFEFDVGKTFKAAKADRDFTTPPRYPGIEMDIALVIDEDVAHSDIERRIRALGKKSALTDVDLFDIYRGKGVPQGKKSMAYRLGYRSENRTLTTEEVERIHEKVLEKLKKELGAELRS
ncbi:MAG: phenylalanine--tRNA ligase subunit beta [Actinomycetia bacterium]|nr:phenylalanine--tRNA ligase subunit beta [Actinomycetes bacterium]